MGNPVQHRLIQADPKWQAFFHHSADLFCIIEPDGRIGQLNPAWRKVLGWTPENVRSRHWIELVHSEDVTATLTALATKGVPVSFRNRYRHYQGNYHWLEWTWNYDEAGYGYAVAREITDQLPGDCELDRFFNMSVNLMGIAGTDGYFQRVNPAFERVLGYPLAELLTQPFLEFVHPDDRAATLTEVEKLATGTTSIQFENRYRCQDGSYRWLAWNSASFPAKELIYTVGRDITHQKQTEAILQETQERYELVAERSNDGLWDWNLETDHVYYSPCWSQTLGYQAEEISDRFGEWLDRIHPGDRERVIATFQNYIDGVTPNLEIEHRLLHKDGSYRWILSRGASLRNAKGQPYRIVGSNRDISDRKRTMSTLRLTQERLHYLLSHSSAVLYSCQVSGNYGVTFMSDNAAIVLGYSAQDFITDSQFWVNHIHPEDVPRVLANLPKLFDRGHHVHEYRFLHQDGTYRWMHDELKLIYDEAGKPLEMVGCWTDITEQKHAEIILKQQTKALQDAHQRLGFHVENSPLAVVEWDNQFRVQRWSKQAEKIFGWTMPEVLGKRSADWQFIYQEDIEIVQQEMSRLLDGSTSSVVYQNRNLTKDGRVVICQWYESALLDESGKMVSILSLVQDITEAKQTEAALRHNAEMLRLLLEYTPAAIAMFDKQMNYQLVSRRWLDDYNLENQDIIGKNHYELFPEIPDTWKQIHQRCLQGASEQCDEDLFIRADGETQWISWEIRPWIGNSGDISGIIMNTEVVTERKQAKEKLKELNQELWQSNRDLEQFAYVASHDLQEPLRAVNSYAQLLSRKYQNNLDAKADKYLHYIMDGATRMQQLINDLLEFSRVGTRGKPLQATDSETIIQQAMENLKVAIAESKAIVTYDILPTVIADQTQLTQLFQNLIGNAIKFRRETPPNVHISAQNQGNEWTFVVRDNGIGMESEYLERIFTIFQRLHSRRDYPGTGIGLAICKKIVERHGGRIWVNSELGIGTTFYFTIPI